MEDLRCDILIVGGSLGGVAAAERAAAMGKQTCLLAETEWIGGQLTERGVCTPDENHWIETVGGTAAYRDLRRQIRTFYRTTFRLSEQGAHVPADQFNPGNCWVNTGSAGGFGLSVEPGVALQLLQERLESYRHLVVRYRRRAVAAELRGDRVAALLAEGPGGERMRLTAPLILDATELGDLLPLAGIEHVIGAESTVETGEPYTPPLTTPRPEWVQPITFPFALAWHPEPGPPIEPPAEYAALKKLQNYRLRDGGIHTMFRGEGMWSYRRFLAAGYFDDARLPHELSMFNTDSIDYQGGPVPSGSAALDAERLAEARRAAVGYIYWLQTECPRDEPDTGFGYPELQPHREAFGTADGVASAPYIRESRRIQGLVRVAAQDILRPAPTPPRARLFRDSCGIGHYAIDIHHGGPPSLGQPYLGLPTRPFQIPLGALIPVRVANVLAAGKNLGVTHLAGAAYRTHAIEWSIGEAAGALAAFCLDRDVWPHAVHSEPELLRSYQCALLRQGIPLYWWSDVPQEHPAFLATQLLGVLELLPGDEALEFRPGNPLSPAEASALRERVGRPLVWPGTAMSRGDAVRWLAQELGLA
jgi:hypothetical protein